jgi:hypothetical protein
LGVTLQQKFLFNPLKIEFMNGLFKLYVEGSVGWMTLITLALVGVLIAMWKAPKWVRELGLLGLSLGLLGWFTGFCQAFVDIMLAGDISMGVVCGGVKVALIAPLYGILVYLVSVVISTIQSPRK